MNKLFVPYNIALSLKEIGFDTDFIGHFDKKKKVFLFDEPVRYEDVPKGFLLAPLYDQVIDWFIEKHDSFLEVQHLRYPRTMCRIIIRSWYTRGKIIKTEALPRYEALNAGIEKCIELIKQKK